MRDLPRARRGGQAGHLAVRAAVQRPVPAAPTTALASSRAVPARVAATGTAPPYVHVRAASELVALVSGHLVSARAGPNEIVCMHACAP